MSDRSSFESAVVSDDPGLLSHQAEAYVGEDNAQALELLERALKVQPRDVKALKVTALVHLHERQYENAIRFAEECLYYIDEYSRVYANVKIIQADAFFCLGSALYFSGDLTRAEQTLQQILAMKSVVKDGTDAFSITTVEEMIERITDIIHKTKTVVQCTPSQNLQLREKVKKEVQLYNSKQRQCEERKYMSELGMPVAILSKRWMERWQRYVTALSASDEEEQQQQKSADQQEIQAEHPGSIEAGDIIEKSPRFWRDLLHLEGSHSKQFVLKKNVQESDHFTILALPVVQLLHDSYGGDLVKRTIVSLNDDIAYRQVELRLTQIDLRILGEAGRKKATTKRALISKTRTVVWMKKKLEEELGTATQRAAVNIWKLDASEEKDFQQIAQIFCTSRADETIPIQAKLLDKSHLSIDECEISQGQFLIVELSLNNSFTLIEQLRQAASSNTACGQCSVVRDDLYTCECETILYCDSRCQKAHREKHLTVCLEVTKKIQKKVQVLKQYNLTSSISRTISAASVNGLCGLQNLGNTCFMNSSLQCLSNIEELTQFMLSDAFISDLNQENPLGSGGHLAASYAELIKNMWIGQSSSVSPWNLKKTLGKFAPQFSGYSQQDSSELLSYLVDGIHEDLNRVKKKPVVEQKDYQGGNDLEVAISSWRDHLKRNKSIIVDLMVGQFKSTLLCPTCKKVSVTFDPFMTVSLPMPSIMQLLISIFAVSRDSFNTLTQVSLYTKRDASIVELKQLIARECKWTNPEDITICRQSQYNFEVTTFNDNQTVQELIRKKEDFVFAFQTINPIIDYSDLQGIAINQQVNVNLQIKVLDKEKKIFNQLTFCRLFCISQNTPFWLIHVKVWQIYRAYLPESQMEENSKQAASQKNGGFKVDLSRMEIEFLRLEYEQFVKGSGENRRFKLMVEDKFEIGWNSNETLKSLFTSEIENGGTQIDMYLSLQSEFDRHLNFNQYQQQKQPTRNSYNIMDSLDLFTSSEVLDKGNEWYCSVCRQHKQATKRLEIFETPKILVLHLKRFRQNRAVPYGNQYFSGGGTKLEDFIDFPVTSLDLSKYTLAHSYRSNDSRSSREDSRNVYDLFAVSNHYGMMGGGHYTAYAKNAKTGKWYEYDDSRVTEITEKKIVTSAAYVLFYRKRKD